MQPQGLGWVQALGERSSGQTLGLVTVGLCVWGWSHPSGAGGREGCQAQEGPAGPWGTQCALYAALGWSPSQGPAGATWGALPVPGPVGRPPPLRWWPLLHPLHPPRPGRHLHPAAPSLFQPRLPGRFCVQLPGAAAADQAAEREAAGPPAGAAQPLRLLHPHPQPLLPLGWG